MKRILMSEKRFTQILLAVWCFSFGILFTLAMGGNDIHYDVTEIIYTHPANSNNVHQNYSNDMVRNAIDYSSRYVTDEALFKSEQYPGWILWKDYESRVTNASYTFWILSYSFGI